MPCQNACFACHNAASFQAASTFALFWLHLSTPAISNKTPQIHRWLKNELLASMHCMCAPCLAHHCWAPWRPVQDLALQCSSCHLRLRLEKPPQSSPWSSPTSKISEERQQREALNHLFGGRSCCYSFIQGCITPVAVHPVPSGITARYQSAWWQNTF